MQTVTYIITDCGDGSNSILWFKDTPYEVFDKLDEVMHSSGSGWEYEQFQSGDGLQLNTISFPDEFPLDSIVGISWGDEQFREDYPELYE